MRLSVAERLAPGLVEARGDAAHYQGNLTMALRQIRKMQPELDRLRRVAAGMEAPGMAAQLERSREQAQQRQVEVARAEARVVEVQAQLELERERCAKEAQQLEETRRNAAQFRIVIQLATARRGRRRVEAELDKVQAELLDEKRLREQSVEALARAEEAAEQALARADAAAEAAAEEAALTRKRLDAEVLESTRRAMCAEQACKQMAEEVWREREAHGASVAATLQAHEKESSWLRAGLQVFLALGLGAGYEPPAAQAEAEAAAVAAERAEALEAAKLAQARVVATEAARSAERAEHEAEVSKLRVALKLSIALGWSLEEPASTDQGSRRSRELAEVEEKETEDGSLSDAEALRQVLRAEVEAAEAAEERGEEAAAVKLQAAQRGRVSRGRSPRGRFSRGLLGTQKNRDEAPGAAESGAATALQAVERGRRGRAQAATLKGKAAAGGAEQAAAAVRVQAVH